jgi:hypothetical protein
LAESNAGSAGHRRMALLPSSVVLRECPEGGREFPSELGIARTRISGGVREFPSELGIARTRISGGRSGVSVRARDCSDYQLDRMKGAAIADPETGSSPDNLLTAMHSGSSANCSSQKI